MASLFQSQVHARGGGVVPFNIGVGAIAGGTPNQHTIVDGAGAVFAVDDSLIAAAVNYSGGISFDADGRCRVSTTAAPTHFGPGATPFDAQGNLCVGGAGTHVHQGILYATDGALAGATGVLTCGPPDTEAGGTRLGGVEDTGLILSGIGTDTRTLTFGGQFKFYSVLTDDYVFSFGQLERGALFFSANGTLRLRMIDGSGQLLFQATHSNILVNTWYSIALSINTNVGSEYGEMYVNHVKSVTVNPVVLNTLINLGSGTWSINQDQTSLPASRGDMCYQNFYMNAHASSDLTQLANLCALGRPDGKPVITDGFGGALDSGDLAGDQAEVFLGFVPPLTGPAPNTGTLVDFVKSGDGNIIDCTP